jgi:hypothetical protein
VRTTCPSGHATDGIRLSTAGAAESFRFDRAPNRDNVYINGYSPESMEEADKKSESEMKVKIIELERRIKMLEDTKNKILLQAIKTTELLLYRVKALEEHLTSLDHTHEQGNDIRDGGWFD